MRIASKCVAGWLAVAGLMCAPVFFGQEVSAPAMPAKAKTVEITPTNIQAHVGDKIKLWKLPGGREQLQVASAGLDSCPCCSGPSPCTTRGRRRV
jgi:hypothetical protein